MRTTLINTTFWKEDTIDLLHLDSKLLYLYMLTNPEKGLANIYHYKPKVISAYSGLSTEQVEVAVKQLIDLGYVNIFDGFYILAKGHEMAKKGRFTDKTVEKEKELIPEHVLDHFNLLVDDEILQSSSGVAPEHIDKDNNKDIYITKTNTNNINEMLQSWESIVGYELTSKMPANRKAVSDIIKHKTKDEVERMLTGVAMSQTDQFAPRISNYIDLNKKWDELIAWGKRQSVSHISKVVKI